MESQLKVELRTANRDRGLTVLLWMKDVLDNLPADVRLKIRRVAIVDTPAAQRDIMEVLLKDEILYLSCKSSLSYLHYQRCHTLFRKMLVRLRLSNDGTPIDQRDTVRRIQMLRQKLRNTLAVSLASKPARVLLRVDDFPSLCEESKEFARFHSIALENNIPYLLGVTPYLARQSSSPHLTDPEHRLLRQCAREGAEIALHGITHQKRSERPASELMGLSEQALQENIIAATGYLDRLGLRVSGFIAPFNSYDPRTLQVVAQHFKVMTGGPESVYTLGFLVGPCFLYGSLYVPSYRSTYDLRARDLRSFESLLTRSEGLVLPVTLHWADELQKDGFKTFRALCALIRDRALSWRDYVQDCMTVHRSVFSNEDREP